MEAYVGDIADSRILEHQYDFFYELANGRSEYAYGELKQIEFDKSHYLMFAIEDLNDAWSYRLKETTDPPKLYYGWAEYAVSEDGTFMILNSASQASPFAAEQRGVVEGCCLDYLRALKSPTTHLSLFIRANSHAAFGTCQPSC